MAQDPTYNDVIASIVPGRLAPYEGEPIKSFQDINPLPKNLQKELEKVVREVTRRDLYPRRFEIRESRLQRFYYRGDQHLIWNQSDQSWDVASRSNFTTNDETSDNESEYRYTLNIYHQCAKTLIASLTQNQPGVRFLPSDPSNPSDINTATAAATSLTLPTSGTVATTSQTPLVGTVTTTSAASDSVTVSGLTSAGHCVATATNSTAAGLTGVYLGAAGSGSVTLYHSSTSGGTFNVICTQN